MSYLGPCGLENDHEQHWVTAPPEGGLGGHYCDGRGTPLSAEMQAMLDLLTEKRDES